MGHGTDMLFEAYQGNQVLGMTADFLELFSERPGVSLTMVPTTSWLKTIRFWCYGFLNL